MSTVSAIDNTFGEPSRPDWGRRKTTAGLVMCATILAACQSQPPAEPPQPQAPIVTPQPETATKPTPATSPAEPPAAPASQPPKAPSVAAAPRAEKPSPPPKTVQPEKKVEQGAPLSTPRLRGDKPSPGQNQHYDRSNPSYATLQKANTALARFPLDDEGQIDWVGALRSGKIKPRVSVTGVGQMRRDTREIIMRNTREMPFVMFPHSVHTEWLDCSNCHDAIFVAKQGANAINMDAIFRGRFCGVCHDKVAFSTYVCDRCHSVPNPDS